MFVLHRVQVQYSPQFIPKIVFYIISAEQLNCISRNWTDDLFGCVTIWDSCRYVVRKYCTSCTICSLIDYMEYCLYPSLLPYFNSTIFSEFDFNIHVLCVLLFYFYIQIFAMTKNIHAPIFTDVFNQIKCVTNRPNVLMIPMRVLVVFKALFTIWVIFIKKKCLRSVLFVIIVPTITL